MIERSDPVNWSTLKHILVSPKHYRYALEHERADSEALQLGRLTHCAVYEPDELTKRYVCEPNFHRGMNDATAIEKGYDGGKQAAADFDADGREPIKPDLWQRATAMAAALHADPIAAPLIVGGFAEQLVTWTDPLTDIECRGRIDHVNGRLSDLKTSRSVDPRWFARQAAQLKYHGQIAYYGNGLEANGITLDEPEALIVVENIAPHDVAVMTFAPQEIRAGQALCRKALDLLAWCRERDEWPGVAGGQAIPLGLPGWAVPDDEEPLTLGGEPMW